MSMRAFLVVLEIESVEVGRVYSSLPLHCSIVNWFRIEAGSEEVLNVLKRVLKNHRPVELISEAPDFFGVNNTIPVFTLVRTDALQKLHIDLFQQLASLSPIYLEPQFAGEYYRPHVTTQGATSFSVGSKVVAKNIYLVEALNVEMITEKKVVVKIPLD